MPIVSQVRKELFRAKFGQLVHNKIVRVRIFIDEISVQENPNFKAQMQVRRGILGGFECSIFPILSGKLTRLFRAKLEQLIVQSGLLDTAEFIIQFVSDQYILRAVIGESTNGVPSSTSLEAVEDFIAKFVKVGAKVTNVTDGSSAIVTVVAQNELTTEALTGGTLNVYTLGDTYTVDNLNKLLINDQVEIENKWRTVISVIPDSEGIQETVLLGD